MNYNLKIIKRLLRVTSIIHLLIAISVGILEIIKYFSNDRELFSMISFKTALIFGLLGIISEVLIYYLKRKNYFAWSFSIFFSIILLFNPIIVFLIAIFLIYNLLSKKVREFFVSKIQEKLSKKKFFIILRVVSLFFFIKALLLSFMSITGFGNWINFNESMLLFKVLLIFTIFICFVIAIIVEVMVYLIEKEKFYLIKFFKYALYISNLSLIFPITLVGSIKLSKYNQIKKTKQK